MPLARTFKNAIGDAVDSANDFYEIHMKSLVSGPVPNTEFNAENFDPKKTRFYQQFLSNVPDFKKAINAMYDSTVIRETWKNGLNNIKRDAAFINDLKGGGKKEEALTAINKQLENSAVKDIKFQTQQVPSQPQVPSPELAQGAPTHERSTYYSDQLAKLNQDCTPDTKKKVVEGLYAHPFFSPNEAETTMSDRLVFIAVTYIIRCISLFIVDWAVNVQMVDTIEQVFFTYIITYILMFMVLVLLANTEKTPGTINPFKLFLYYINTDASGIAVVRICIHILVQLFIFPIIYIVKDSDTSNSVDTPYEFKQKVNRVLGNISMFMWIIASIICLRA